MPNIKISNTSVDKIQLPEPGQRVFYWDDQLKGFCVKAVSTGLFYMVQRRTGGRGSKIVKHVIGKHGEISAPEARKQAAMALAELRQGINLNEQKEQREAEKVVNSLTLQQAYDEFKTSRTLRPRTLQTYDDNINRCAGDWLDLPIVSITSEMIQKRHKKLSTAGKDGRGKGSANQFGRLLRVVFNYVILTKDNGKGQPLIVENPVKKLSQLQAWNKLEPRDNIIQPDDLQRWYEAVMALESKKLQDFFLFLIFSGIRRNEAMSLKWADVDTRGAILTLPAEITKTGKKRQLPLTDVLCDILSRRKQNMVVGNPYVFQGMHGRGRLTEPKRAVAIVNEALEKDAVIKGISGIDWSPHDLRRTYATIASRLDVSYYKLKHLLGHSVSGDVTGNHYVQCDVETLREPAQKIANYLKEKMVSIPPSKAASK